MTLKHVIPFPRKETLVTNQSVSVTIFEEKPDNRITYLYQSVFSPFRFSSFGPKTYDSLNKLFYALTYCRIYLNTDNDRIQPFIQKISQIGLPRTFETIISTLPSFGRLYLRDSNFCQFTMSSSDIKIATDFIDDADLNVTLSSLKARFRDARLDWAPTFNFFGKSRAILSTFFYNKKTFGTAPAEVTKYDVSLTSTSDQNITDSSLFFAFFTPIFVSSDLQDFIVLFNLKGRAMIAQHEFEYIAMSIITGYFENSVEEFMLQTTTGRISQGTSQQKVDVTDQRYSPQGPNVVGNIAQQNKVSPPIPRTQNNGESTQTSLGTNGMNMAVLGLSLYHALEQMGVHITSKI